LKKYQLNWQDICLVDAKRSFDCDLLTIKT